MAALVESGRLVWADPYVSTCPKDTAESARSPGIVQGGNHIMISYSDGQIGVISRKPVFHTAAPLFTERDAKNALRFHRSLPDYRETPLVSLACTAERYGIGSIFVKDESARFGLKAFKGLGGSYGMFRILCDRLALNPETADYTSYLDEDVREKCSRIVFVTATDGNHGKGVSWAAKLFGCRAHVFMPKGTVEARRQAIESAGSAVAEITALNYDQTVEYAAELAEKHGWILIQDTAWDGYEQIPKWIMEGYLTLILEAQEQMCGKAPTHVFLQAGVGSMAGGIESYLLNHFRSSKPMITIVEPTEASCIYQSVLAGDGKPHTVPGNPVTIMAGLNCGTPCSIVWPVLRDETSCFCTCRDVVTEIGMRAYASPVGADRPIISGESGAVTYGLLLSVLKNDKLRDLFNLRKDSIVLLISTEGNTDPEGYARIVQ